MFWVYVLKNPSNKIYIGYTSNLEIRLQRHNKLLKTKSKSFTYKNSGPWEIVYKESYPTKSEAILREKQLKSYQGRKFIKSLLK